MTAKESQQAVSPGVHQLARLGARPRKAAVRPLPSGDAVAVHEPVAAVAVDVPLPHLDHPFEYAVPAALDDLLAPGARVKVRFAGQDVAGVVLERRAEAAHEGRLTPVRRVVSPEPVLGPDLLALCRAVAADHAGTLGDVLRLALPPRHAGAEKALPAVGPELAPVPAPDPGPWAAYPAGSSFVRRLAAGEAPTAAWTALPQAGGDWAAALAVAAAATLSTGRGVALVVPDHRDVARVDAALLGVLGRGRHVRLTADQGPQARYTAWLKLRRGHVRCVVGTRAAAFAPVHDPGLLAWWDDGDDLHAEPRTPYPHVRDVLVRRGGLAGTALLAGGLTRTTHVQQLLERGVLREIAPEPTARRHTAPRLRLAQEGRDAERDGPAARAHLPSAAWRAAREALDRGPVLVQVPRRGYLPALSCAHCRAPARCSACRGPLSMRGPGASPTCRWCGTAVTRFQCAECGDLRLRSSVVGARRTAEELGRAFPGVTVRTSGGTEVHATVPATPALVIATPGAEPLVEGGYAAALLLDAWALLERPRLDAGEEALRRWLTAAALTRHQGIGGVIVLCGTPEHTTLPAVEALMRWAPEWYAARELAERRELGLPPTTWTARLTGEHAALAEALTQTDLPAAVEIIGPLPVDEVARAGSGAGAVGAGGAEADAYGRTTPKGGGAGRANGRSAASGGEAVRGGRPGRSPADADPRHQPRHQPLQQPVRQARQPAQVLLRGPWTAAPEATRALLTMRRVRSARRGAPAVSVRIGDADLR